MTFGTFLEEGVIHVLKLRRWIRMVKHTPEVLQSLERFLDFVDCFAKSGVFKSGEHQSFVSFRWGNFCCSPKTCHNSTTAHFLLLHFSLPLDHREVDRLQIPHEWFHRFKMIQMTQICILISPSQPCTVIASKTWHGNLGIFASTNTSKPGRYRHGEITP